MIWCGNLLIKGNEYVIITVSHRKKTEVNILELPAKVVKALSATRWYHATTKTNFESIMDKGVVADYNRFGELDFGYGFYLTPTEKLAESYISKLLSWVGMDENDPPVIMEYEMCPLDWFTGETYKTAFFPAFDDSFAEFCFQNRVNCNTGEQIHDYDVIYGVMSDSVPTKLLLQYRAGEISREAVLEGLKKGNSMKQISLHNQHLCDIIKLRKAYLYNIETGERKELDIHERESAASC